MSSLEIYKNHFYIKYYDSTFGYSRRETTGLKATPGNKQEAKRRLKEFQQNRRLGIHLFENKYTPVNLKDALKEFLGLKNFRPKTEEIYNNAVDHLTAVAGSIATKHINKNHIRLLFKRWDDKNLSINSRSMYTRQLSSLWNYFVKAGYASDNIIPVIKFQHKEPEDITLNDLKIILDYLKAHSLKQYNVIKFLFLTGVRISTMLDLDWKDINWKENFVKFRNVKINNQPFYYPLTNELNQLLRSLNPKLSGKIFDYKNKDSIRSLWVRALDECKMPGKYSLHQIRKTYFSLQVNAGISLDDLSRITNTDSRTLKKHYAKFNRERLKAALESTEMVTRYLLETTSEISRIEQRKSKKPLKKAK